MRARVWITLKLVNRRDRHHKLFVGTFVADWVFALVQCSRSSIRHFFFSFPYSITFVPGAIIFRVDSQSSAFFCDYFSLSWSTNRFRCTNIWSFRFVFIFESHLCYCLLYYYSVNTFAHSKPPDSRECAKSIQITKGTQKPTFASIIWNKYAECSLLATHTSQCVCVCAVCECVRVYVNCIY